MEPTPSTPSVIPASPVVPDALTAPPPAPSINSGPTACPQCHVPVRPTDFFCYNCGKNLKPAPPSTSIETLVMYYVGSVLLPPMGIIWGWKYVKATDQKARLHGWLLIGITVVELVLLTIWTIDFVHGINAQVNSQLNGLQGF